jgi:hypothetical protein
MSDFDNITTFQDETPQVLTVRLSKISPFIDGEREFLESIPKFRRAEQRGWTADSGYLMPPIGDITVGIIVSLEFIADSHNPSDGLIVMERR